MAARFIHASATPASLDLSLREMTVEDVVPTLTHETDYGTVLRYVIGTKLRRAKLKLMVTTPTEHDQFWSFYRSATSANSRFTFIADATNFASDTWSAYFMSVPEFTREQMPGARILGTIEVEIQDAGLNL
jgi:hypothetical protein